MNVSQACWNPEDGWRDGVGSGACGEDAQWILAFGSTAAMSDPTVVRALRTRHPHAVIVGCSTSGEIVDTHVREGSVVVTAIRFEHSTLRLASAAVETAEGSHAVGKALAAQLNGPGLVHVFVLSDGLHVNGTTLAAGLRDQLPSHVAVTGGLAGDGERFKHTLVRAGDVAGEHLVAAIGFYGDRLRVGHGSLGGWDSFGPLRLITKSKGNVLYELDGQSALDLYKQYLGDHVAGLPASALLFPLALSGPGQAGLVRTVLGIDEKDKSMIFAGDMPEGACARLMKANVDRLINGAAGAAREGLQGLGDSTPELAVLISCVGRKLVLKQRIEEEVQGVRAVLGDKPVLTGFYSYGELSPHGMLTRCELHNQTMTITTFAES